MGLAQVLIDEPDLLLLDEPTNHLDYEAIQWLEGYLKNYRGALMMVTHDRYFLDRVANRVFELSFGKLYEYQGNYEDYLLARAERERIEETQEENGNSYISTSWHGFGQAPKRERLSNKRESIVSTI